MKLLMLRNVALYLLAGGALLLGGTPGFAQELPKIGFSTDYMKSVGEADGVVVFTVKLSPASANTVTVQYATEDDSATAPSDYISKSGTLTFAPGETEKQISITIVNDTVVEPTESAYVDLSNAQNAELDSFPRAIFYIVDDDEPPPPPPPLPSVQFGVYSYWVSESGGAGVIVVTLTAAASTPITVNYATSDGPMPNGAIAGTDYVATSGVLTFAPGETGKTFAVPIIDNSVAGPNKTVGLQLSAPSGATLGASTAELTIVDDDVSTPTVQFDKSEYEFYESEGLVGVTFTLSFPPLKDTTVGYKIAAGTATEGSDYSVKDKDGNSVPAEGQLTFLAGEWQQTIYLKLEADGIPEEAESVEASIFPVNADVMPGAITSATVYIVDGDEALPTIQFSPKTYSASENVGTTTVEVSLSKASAMPIRVLVQSTDGTATAPEDYRAVNEIVKFEKGATTASFTVTIMDGKLIEPNEEFTLKLSQPSKGAVIGTDDTATVKIIDGTLPTDEGATTLEIRPDANQRGVTGDVVESTKGGVGLRHYVSPKKADDYVVVRCVKADGSKIDKFDDSYEWGAEGVAGATPDTRKVSRNAAGRTELKVKSKGGKDVLTQMNVWIVWATIEAFKDEDMLVFYPKAKPRGDVAQKCVAGNSIWSFLATIEPAAIFNETTDIPNLKGIVTHKVPGWDKKHIVKSTVVESGAEYKWDISRRVSVKIKSLVVSTNDHDAVKGKCYDGLPSVNPKIQELYPADEAQGNDDSGTDDEDNNPYSDQEPWPFKFKDGKQLFAAKGQIASIDRVTGPLFRHGAGANGDNYEYHMHFGEFARLQIGNSNVANYRNWYRVSDYKDWRHVVKLEKASNTWNNKGSIADTNNDDW